MRTSCAGWARPKRESPLYTVVKQAWVGRLGVMDTQAKGDKARWLGRQDRVNTLTKLTKPARVNRLGGGWNRGAMRARRVDEHQMDRLAQREMETNEDKLGGLDWAEPCEPGEPDEPGGEAGLGGPGWAGRTRRPR